MTQHNRETLLALADRAEKATGPDREIDLDILIALHPGARRKGPGEAFIPERGWEPGSYSRSAHTYTASLDAAMSLVPEGAKGALFFGVAGGPPAATVFKQTTPFYGNAAAPALALCAAALRARATLDPTGEKA